MAWLDSDDKSSRSNRRAHAEFRAGVDQAAAYLRSRDPVLKKLIERFGPCKLVLHTGYFPVVVETVISQQLSTRAAKSIYGRLIGLIGRGSPRPVDILEIPDDELLKIGFSRSKVRYIKNAAELFRSQRLGPKAFARMPDEKVAEVLTSIKGIGEWSAHMFLIFALGRLDVFPIGDLGLRNAMARAYRLRTPPAHSKLRTIAERWRPYRTVGTWYLWESYDNG